MKITERVELKKEAKYIENPKIENSIKDIDEVIFLNESGNYFIVINEKKFKLNQEDYYNIKNNNEIKITEEIEIEYKEEYITYQDFHQWTNPEEWITKTKITIMITEKESL